VKAVRIGSTITIAGETRALTQGVAALARKKNPVPSFDRSWCGGVSLDHVAIVLGQLVVEVLWGMRQEVAMLVNRAALDRQVLAPQRHEGGFQPGAPSTITNPGLLRPRASGSSRNLRQAAVLSPPIFLMESSTFCPSRRTPMAGRDEMFVALRSSRVLITVPWRISRRMSSYQSAISPTHCALVKPVRRMSISKA
jgi:hypothetical protein